MKNASFISFMMGMAYIALALISLLFDMPIRITNSVSFGAVLLSISEVLIVINNQRIKERSFVKILNNPELNNKTTMALSYINEILNEKVSIASANNSVLFYLSLVLKTAAFFCIILLPFFPYWPPFFETSKFGTFCTVLSLGIIFISFHFDSSREEAKELADMKEMGKCYYIALNEKNKIIDQNLKALTHHGTNTKKKNKTAKKKK